MSANNTPHWIERCLSAGKLILGFLVVALVYWLLDSGFVNRITGIEAGGVKFEVGRQSGLATAQQNYADPLSRLSKFRETLIEARYSQDPEIGEQALRELDTILIAFGVAERDLAARAKELHEFAAMRQQLQQSQQLISELQTQKDGKLPENSLKPADTKKSKDSKTTASSSNSNGGYDYDYNLTSPSYYSATPVNTYSGSDYAQEVRPNLLQRMLGGLKFKSPSKQESPRPPPFADGAYNPYPGEYKPYKSPSE